MFGLHPSTLFAAAFAALVVPVLAYPNPGAVSGAIDAVHDPSALCKDSAGKYWLFSTGEGIPIRTSTDRTKWTSVGTVWPKGGYSWTEPYTKAKDASLWAPDCTYKNGQFYLYYSASTFGKSESAIFFATSKTGAPGSWTNQGLVTSSTSSSNYNAIDPNLFIDGSNWWLVFGSFWSGIKLVPISSSTGKLASSKIYSLATRSAGVEAPILFKQGSYYYLFTSNDKCCSGTSSTYNVRVGRSKTISGPYLDKSGVDMLKGGGTLVLATHGSIVGPGGQSIYQDNDGVVIVYHYYTSTTSKLAVNLLDFSSGWPVAY